MHTGDAMRKRWIPIIMACLLCLAMLAGCSGSQESADAVDDAEEAAEITEESVTADEFETAFKEAKEYKDELTVTIHTAKGEDIEIDTSGTGSLAAAKNVNVEGVNVKYNKVYGAAATSTLKPGKFNYSVGNMLDWDVATCWAEGNPNSEGTLEGFAYYMNSGSRVDGFRIYPGYQKSKKVYRTNIVPAALLVEVGGYTFSTDLSPWLMDLQADDAYYWVDITFGTPVYTDSMYVRIAAVTTYGNDPDYDCCISEFHPFHF